MSDHQPPENPYGQQPAQPAYQSQGQAGYDQSSYHQQYYDAPPPADAGWGVAPDQRPGTVTAAGWITILSSGLTALLMGVFALAGFVARDPMIDALREDPDVRDALGDEASLDGIANAAIGFFSVMTVWAVIALILGVLVLRRSNVGRILLVISSAVCALVTLGLAFLALIPAVWTLASVAVIVLLFVGGAGDWFARRSSAPAYGEPFNG